MKIKRNLARHVLECLVEGKTRQSRTQGTVRQAKYLKFESDFGLEEYRQEPHVYMRSSRTFLHKTESICL